MCDHQGPNSAYKLAYIYASVFVRTTTHVNLRFAYIYFPCFPPMYVLYAVRIVTMCPRYKVGPSRNKKKKKRGYHGNLCNSVKFCPILTQQKKKLSGFYGGPGGWSLVFTALFYDPPVDQKHYTFFRGLVHACIRTNVHCYSLFYNMHMLCIPETNQSNRNS